MAAPLRIALVGLGQAARNIHLPALDRLAADYRLDAACDPDETARKAFVRSRPGIPAAPSHEQLLERRPDVFLIASPPAFHAAQAIAALAAGCHVFCEKPMAETLEQADGMLESARIADRRLLINSQFPDMRIHRAALERIGSPDFGRLLFLRATQSFRTDQSTEAGWRASAQRRVCLDFGWHVFDLAWVLFGGPPARLDCRMPRPTGDGESLNLIHLEWPDGRAASVTLNRLARGPHRYLELELTGERGEIATSIGGEARLEVGLRGRPKRPYVGAALAAGGRAVLRQGDDERTIATESPRPFVEATRLRLEALARWIRDGAIPERGPSYHRDLLALTLAAYDSADSGETVDLRCRLSK